MPRRRYRRILDTLCSNPTPNYIALSYAWGDAESPRETIQINGVTVQIRENLRHALDSIISVRDAVNDGPAGLWIDSICIDQSNTAEKNHQVQQMSNIYSTATTVVSWLGLHTPEIAIFFQWGMQQSSVRRGENWRHTLSLGPTLSLRPTLSKAVEELLSRNYWKRLWIVQEVLLALDHQIMCGTDCVAGDDFFNRWITAPGGVPLHGPPGEFQWFDKTVEPPGYRLLREKCSGYGDIYDFQSLYRLFCAFHRQDCMNLLDKIFGLLGIITSYGRESPIAVDYGKTPEQLCFDVLDAVRSDLRHESPSDAGWFAFSLLKALQLYEDDSDESGTGSKSSITERVDGYLENLGMDRPPTWDGDGWQDGKTRRATDTVSIKRGYLL